MPGQVPTQSMESTSLYSIWSTLRYPSFWWVWPTRISCLGLSSEENISILKVVSRRSTLIGDLGWLWLMLSTRVVLSSFLVTELVFISSFSSSYSCSSIPHLFLSNINSSSSPSPLPLSVDLLWDWYWSGRVWIYYKYSYCDSCLLSSCSGDLTLGESLVQRFIIIWMYLPTYILTIPWSMYVLYRQ